MLCIYVSLNIEILHSYAPCTAVIHNIQHRTVLIMFSVIIAAGLLSVGGMINVLRAVD